MFRPMRRFKEQISNDECERILHTAKRGVLSLLGDEGYPYGLPLNYVYADGTIYLHSALSGHKVDAVKACNKASFCVLEECELSGDGWSYFFNSVIAFGKIQIVEDEEEKLLRLNQLGLKYFPTVKDVDDDIRENAARCLVLALSIEHMTGKHIHER